MTPEEIVQFTETTRKMIDEICGIPLSFRNTLSYKEQAMEINADHRALIAQTFKKLDGKHGQQELLHGIVGLTGEVGELVDAVKKHVYYGKLLDRDNVIEELGDIEYYLEAIRQNLIIDRDYVLLKNVEKLEKRYPGRVFSEKAAQERADKVRDPGKIGDVPTMGEEAEALLKSEVEAAPVDPATYSKNLSYNSHPPGSAEWHEFQAANRFGG